MRGIYTYKITLSNTTSTATPPNLQVRLNINFSAIVGLNPNLSNIRFSSDQAGNNLLYAWLESAPQGTFTQGTNVSSYTSSNVWVNLGNNIIPANGSLNIYMQVLSSGTDFDGVYWGANPQWTSTYGQYDNGANVFPFYDNFAGTSLNTSKWSGSLGTVDNGLTATTAPSSGFGLTSTQSFSLPLVVEADASFSLSDSTATGDYVSGFGFAYSNGAQATHSSMADGLDAFGINGWTGSSSFWSSADSPQPAPSTYYVWGLTITSATNITGYVNYVKTSSTSTAISQSGNLNVIIWMQFNNVFTQKYYWIRTRAYPPNGIDPVLTSIILLVGNYTSASIPSPEWTTLSGKPYITVSAKGISNGLSNIPNDGADFGPDTLLGASSPSQYGPPYTQTSGIQEGINYAFANNITLDIKAGQYIISAPLQQDPNDALDYYQIGIPYATAFQTLNIVCEGYVPIGYSYPGAGTTEQPNDLLYSGPTPVTGVQLLSTITTGPPAVANTSGQVLYVLKNPNTPNAIPYTGIRIQGGLRVTIQPGVALTGINLYHAQFVDADTLMADIDLTESNNIPNPANATGSLSTDFNFTFTGVVLPKILTNGSIVRNIDVTGYYSGVFISSSHTLIEHLVVQSCWNGIVTFNYGHYSNIIYADIEECPVTIHNHCGSGQSSQLNILSLDMEVNYGVSTGPEAWMNFVTDYETEGGAFYGVIRYHKQGVNMPTGAATTFYMNNYEPNIIALPYDIAGLTPTISANPPASGTVYQNTNPYNIRIYLPAYATTSGTAGSVAIALGSTSTPSTIGTKFINGSTSSSATEIIELVVPAGWYYEFTSTGVTFGTATVFPA
ncbi:MAG: hypothetical protein QW203_03795 [Thermoplasmatales archaeon]